MPGTRSDLLTGTFWVKWHPIGTRHFGTSNVKAKNHRLNSTGTSNKVDKSWFYLFLFCFFSLSLVRWSLTFSRHTHRQLKDEVNYTPLRTFSLTGN